MVNEALNINLDELFQIENFSVRSKNICEWNSLIDINSILNHYWEYGDFLKLRNCGEKSNLELVDVCKKYEKLIIKPKPENHEVVPANPILEKIESLTIRQKQIINNLLENQFKELSARSSNALISYLGSDISIKGFKSILSNQESDLKDLRNVGVISINEINAFINSLKEIIELVSVFKNEDELTIELFNTYLSKKFLLDPILIAEIGKNYDFSYGLPIFKTCNVLIEHEILFDKRDKIIFENGFDYKNSLNVLTLDELSAILNITKERTRQIRVNIFDNLIPVFSFIKGFEFETVNFYGIDINSDIIDLPDEIITEINEKEKNDFNRLFVNKIFFILLDKSYSLIGNEENILCNRSIRSAHNWNNTYLVKTEFTINFDFEEFINNVSKRLNERIEEDYSFHFETYLMNFQKSECTEISKKIIQISEHILFREFELIVDIYENIVFKRNTIKQVYEYSYEALEALGQPSKVIEIYKKVTEFYPDYDTDENSIRASMQRKNGFVPFGRTSVYGLKVWEEDRDIRGGTIRDITEEYLTIQSEPMHINEITEYVNKYRDTTAKNIYSNLLMEDNNRFVFYKGLCIGLKSKKYNEENLIRVVGNQIDKKTWDESFSLLEEFVIQNKRLPNSTGNDIEKKLYRFFNIQLRKANNALIDEIKVQKIQSFVNLYDYHKRARRNPKNINQSYDELKLFITKYKRLPKVHDTEGMNLYHFYYKQTSLYRNGKLSNELLGKYLEIINLTQTKNEY